MPVRNDLDSAQTACSQVDELYDFYMSKTMIKCYRSSNTIQINQSILF